MVKNLGENGLKSGRYAKSLIANRFKKIRINFNNLSLVCLLIADLALDVSYKIVRIFSPLPGLIIPKPYTRFCSLTKVTIEVVKSCEFPSHTFSMGPVLAFKTLYPCFPVSLISINFRAIDTYVIRPLILFGIL